MTELLCLHLDRVLTEVCAFKLKLKLIVRNQEHFPILLRIMLYKVVLTVDRNLKILDAMQGLSLLFVSFPAPI